MAKKNKKRSQFDIASFANNGNKYPRITCEQECEKENKRRLRGVFRWIWAFIMVIQVMVIIEVDAEYYSWKVVLWYVSIIVQMYLFYKYSGTDWDEFRDDYDGYDDEKEED